MKKLNLHQMFLFGKHLSSLSTIRNDSKVFDELFNLWWAREALDELVVDDSPLLSTARRAARKLIEEVNEVLPRDITKATEVGQDATIGWRSHSITRTLGELESVLANDMPDIAAYVVSQKGIYRTDDLIAHAENQLSGEVRKTLPEIACFDLQQAGKCLAYELATACAFHLWRAVETIMGEYYKQLSGGNTFDDDKVQRNWAGYIKALDDKKADKRVTVFLNHIRDEYRNPQTHPDEKIDIDDALRLCSVATSSVDQMMRAVLSLQRAAAASMTAAALALIAPIKP